MISEYLEIDVNQKIIYASQQLSIIQNNNLFSYINIRYVINFNTKCKSL